MNSVTGLLGSLLGDTGGAFFWDAGTLAHRVYTGQGLKLLSLLDLSRLWSNPGGIGFGNLNLAGLLNPLASLPRNYLIWGDVAVWAANDEIIWGTNDEIIWGTNDRTRSSGARPSTIRAATKSSGARPATTRSSGARRC